MSHSRRLKLLCYNNLLDQECLKYVFNHFVYYFTYIYDIFFWQKYLDNHVTSPLIIKISNYICTKEINKILISYVESACRYIFLGVPNKLFPPKRFYSKSAWPYRIYVLSSNLLKVDLGNETVSFYFHFLWLKFSSFLVIY